MNADVWLWPRVENLPSFVLWKLGRFLYFVQNRVETQFPGPKRVILVSVRWGLIVCFLRFLFLGQFRLELRPRLDLLGTIRWRWRCINWTRFCAENGEKLEILMCVLAPVRNFSFLCFEWVARNSVGSALSIRSGRPLAIFEVTTGSILAGFGCRAIVTSLPRTAGTYPPKTAATPPFGARPPFAKSAPATAGKRTSALAPFVGAQKYY